MTLGTFGMGQQTQLNHLERSHRSLAWIHIVFLFFVSITPFSTMLRAELTAYRTALVVYWLNICFWGFRFISAGIANHLKLVKADLPPEVPPAIKRGIVIAQSLYALGALLCIFSTYLSIAVISALAIELRNRTPVLRHFPHDSLQ